MSSYREFKRDLIWLIAFMWLFALVANAFGWGFDSTDGGERSGLGLYTDNLTGCQYLSAGGFGITPRLDKSGRHICGARND